MAVTTATTTGNDFFTLWFDETNSYPGTASAAGFTGELMRNRAMIENLYVAATGATVCLTADQLRRNEESRQRKQAVLKRIESERLAINKARTLLEQVLDPTQLASFKEFGYFFVVGNETGRRYKVTNGRSGNIFDRHRRLCGHPLEYCPNFDTMLTQKVYLENREAEFLKVAIAH